MDLDDLRTYVETVRRGNLSLAAAALRMSQPTVSRRIGRLEREAGAVLLRRTRPAVTPTRRGLEFLTFAEDTLARWETLRPAPLHGAPPGGPLHIASSTTPAESFLPALLAAFARRQPEVRVHMHVMNSDSVDECARGRHCDVAFLGRPSRNPLLRALPVAEDQVLLAVARGHRLADRDEVDLEDLAGERLLTREPGSATQRAVEEALARRGLALPAQQRIVEVSGGLALLAAVAGGRGIGFVSSLLAGTAGADVRGVRLRQAPVRRTLLLVHAPRGLCPPARAFVDFVAAWAPLRAAPAADRRVRPGRVPRHPPDPGPT